MVKRRRLESVWVALAVLALVMQACAIPDGSGSSPPTVAILSPGEGDEVPLNEALAVQLSASDPDGPGVVRLDVQMGDGVVETLEAADPRPTLTARIMVTPTEAGRTTLTAIAYREDGTASSPATIALAVVGEDTSAGGSVAGPSTAGVQARADMAMAVRERPGVGCPVLGQVPGGTTITLLRRTTSATEYWYQTNYLGDENLGWTYHSGYTLLNDDGGLPRDPEQGCEGVATACGDGACNGGETCETCALDCGACGLPAADGSQCGDGVCQAGESADWCGDCVAEEGEEEEEEGPVCGDGVCNGGEDCTTCSADCGICAVVAGCGNGTCDAFAHENPLNCPTDCFCGDGICHNIAHESPLNCPTDCSCGDGVCQEFAGENPDSCPADCIPLGDVGVSSDVNAKENFGEVDAFEVLETLSEIPITTWNYIEDDESVRHMGPMAQDFYSAFALGTDERTIHLLDANGVTIAAIQALDAQVQEKDARIAEQEMELAAIEARLAALEEASGAGGSQALPPEYVLALAAAAFVAGLAIGRRGIRQEGQA